MGQDVATEVVLRPKEGPTAPAVLPAISSRIPPVLVNNDVIEQTASPKDNPRGRSTTLEAYDYLGGGTLVRRAHSTVGRGHDFSISMPGTGGDPYTGLDRFGRVVNLLRKSVF